MTGPHDRMIAQAAKEALRPLGFHRKGRSRTWIRDQGWWLAVVEFTPSAWTRGSSLTIAAHWLWHEQGFLSFDHCDRLPASALYVSDAQFAPEARRLARTAAAAADALCRTFHSIHAAAITLGAEEKALPERARGGWTAYHAAVANALSGRPDMAEALFHAIRDERVRRAAARLEPHVGDPAMLRREVDTLIAAQRAALGLKPRD